MATVKKIFNPSKDKNVKLTISPKVVYKLDFSAIDTSVIQNSPEFVTNTNRQNNDLILQYVVDENGTKNVLTLCNYFSDARNKNTVTGSLDGQNYFLVADAVERVYSNYTSASKSINSTPAFFAEEIKGSAYNDKITTGQYDDTIIGGAGNDNLTGGAGQNTIYYSKGDGNDIINLTKGENFLLNLTDLTRNDVKFDFVKGDLVISYDYYGEIQKITIKSFGAKDVTNNSSKYVADTSSVEIKFADEENPVDLRTTNELYNLNITSNYTGNRFDENIDASDLQLYTKIKSGKTYQTTENDNTSSKGLTLKGENGNDTVLGSKYSDTINGGNGNDSITGGTGNDNITGGAGQNTVYYSQGDGNDTINLTKGENFLLNLTDLTREDVKFDFVKGDLVISYSYENDEYKVETQKITIKSFGSKDITNNSSKYAADTSSVEIKFADEENPVDLRTTNELYNLNITSNYTGNRFDENIDASDLQLYTKIKSGKTYQTIENNNTTSKGLNINSADGNDTILGSKYSDTINGGNGNDSITGGTGNDNITGGAGQNTIYYSKGDGNDTINLTKGENFLLNLTDLTRNDVKFDFVKGDLVISYDYYGEIQKITIKSFGAKDVTNNSSKYVADTSSVEIKFADEENPVDLRTTNELYNLNITSNYTGNRFDENIDASDYWGWVDNRYSKGLKIDGAGGTNIITGSYGNDTISVGNDSFNSIDATGGNNSITVGNGNNNTINSGDGNNTIKLGSGTNNEINADNGNNTISVASFAKGIIVSEENKNIITLGGGNNKISIGNASAQITAGGGSINLSGIMEGIGNNTITLGNGLWDINTYKGAKAIIKAGNSVANSEIDTGNETDTITVGTGFWDIDAGNGNNVISVGNNDCTQQTLVQAGTGNDTIKVGNGKFDIDAGIGINTITLGTGTNIVRVDDDILSDNTTFVTTNVKGVDTYIFEDNFENYKFIKLNANQNIYDNNNKKYTISTSDLIISKGDVQLLVIKNYFSNSKNADKTYLKFADMTEQTISALGDNFVLNITNSVPQNKVSITGTNYNDMITGGNANDTLNGGIGNDSITGGEGNDQLYGGKGTNHFYFTGDFGIDTIYEEKVNANNILHFDGEITTYQRNNDLVVSKDNANNVIIKDYFTSNIQNKATFSVQINENAIQNIGEYIDYAISMSGSGTINGTSGDDIIYGSNKVDQIRGYAGDDILIGGRGKDVYIFDAGDGQDTINITDSDIKTVKLMDATSLSDISFNDGKIYYSDSDSIKINNMDKYKKTINIELNTNNQLLSLEELAFDAKINTSKTINGTNTNDKIYIYNNSTVKANKGNDVVTIYGSNNKIYGGDGNDDIGLIKNGQNAQVNNNIVYAESGDDYISCDGTNNTVYGGTGNDDITFYNSNYEGSTPTTNTVVFYNGDGNDYIYASSNSNLILKFNNTSASKLTYTKYGDDLIIGHNSGKDTVTLENYYNSNFEYGNIYINNNYTTLESSIKNLKTISTTAARTINGTKNEDRITVYDNATVKANNGNDRIYVYGSKNKIYGSDGSDKINVYPQGQDGSADNNIVYGESGDDSIYCSGNNNTVYGGTGNDYITFSNSNYEGSTTTTNTVVFYNGDGNDYIHASSTNLILKFNNTSASKLTYTKYGDDLIIGHNSGKDTVTIYNYYNSNDSYSHNYYINNINTTLESSIKNLKTISTTAARTINGTKTEDRITVYDNATVKANNGNDRIYVYGSKNKIYGGDGSDRINIYPQGQDGSTDNNIVYGEGGDDSIYCSGNNNTIYGGTGNDYISISNYSSTTQETQTNTIIFKNGDGNDTLYIGGSVTLKFEDTLTNNLTYTQDGNDLIISHNSGKDTVRIQNYYSTTSTVGQISILGKGSLTYSLAQVYNLYQQQVGTNIEGTVEGETINGTAYKDIINGNGGDDIIYAGRGDDVITTLDGDDTINGGYGNDTIYAGSGNDNINNSYGNNEIFGEDGDDYINAVGNIDGGAGDDQIVLSGENTTPITIIGGTGNDNISALGYANTTFLFHNGDGQDTLCLPMGSEMQQQTIKLADTTSWDDVRCVTDEYNTYSSKLYYTDTDYISIGNYTTTEWYYTVELQDGSTKNLYTIRTGKEPPITITGTTNNDSWNFSDNSEAYMIYALNGDDNITTGSGNDIINGSNGDDIINAGDGNNYIEDNYGNNEITTGSGNDTIDAFGNINSGAGNDNVTYSNYYYTDSASQSEYEINLGDGDDTLYISNGYDDEYSLEVIGGKGNDNISTTLYKKQTFIFNTGDGQDNLCIGDIYSYSSNIPQQQTIKLADTTSWDNVRFVSDEYNTYSGKLYYTDTDYIEIQNYATIDKYFNVELQDGSTKNLYTIRTGLEPPVIIIGTTNNDTWNFSANTTTYIINALAGNDIILTGSGDDTIYGGYGDDTINAGDGNNYIYDNYGNNTIITGSGNDTINASGNINSGAGNDIVSHSNCYYYTASASQAKYKINLGDGDDILNISNGYKCSLNVIGGKGNDNISSDTVGTYTFVFNNGDGQDMLNLTSYSDEINKQIIKLADINSWNNVLYDFNISNNTGKLYYSTTDYITLSVLNCGCDSNPENYFVVELANDEKKNLGEIQKAVNIYGTDGDDSINGTDDNDSIYGESGNDTIVAGKGDDYIDGGAGNNRYEFSAGDGNDTIANGDGTDTLKYKEKDGSYSAWCQKSYNSNDLIIKYSASDSITLQDYFENNSHSVKIVNNSYTDINLSQYLSNGNALYIYGTNNNDTVTGSIYNDSIMAGDGNDTIYAGDGDDYIDGEPGNDEIHPGTGSNTIRFSYGNDIYHYEGGQDTLFGEPVSVRKENNNLVMYYDYVNIPNSSINFTIKDYFSLDNTNITVGSDNIKDYINRQKLQIIGTNKADSIVGTSYNDSIYGDAGNDTIYAGDGDDFIKAGSGNNVIVGGRGNDLLSGSYDGNDVYKFALGDGNDTIGYNTCNATIEFSDEVNINNLTYIKENDASYDLTIKYSDSDSIKLRDYFVNGYSYIKTIKIGNTNYDLENIINGMTFTIVGTDGNDSIYGTNLDDTISGNSGNDYIKGRNGNDYIDGGAGNNRYEFSAGDGNDTIINGQGNDTIQFADEQTFTYTKINNSNDLIISYGNSDTIILKDYFVNNSHSVKTIINGDTTLNLIDEVASKLETIDTSTPKTYYYIELNNEILCYDTDKQKIMNTLPFLAYDNLTVLETDKKIIPYCGKFIYEEDLKTAIEGTNNEDILQGTDGDDKIYALAGNDTISGGAGNDFIWGYTGNDTIDGGSGDNTYSFNYGDGNDTILNGTGNDTIKFMFNQDLKYQRIDNSNDLIISYGDSDTIILKDYFVNNSHSVKTIKNGNISLTLSDEVANNLKIIANQKNGTINGTSGNDTINVQNSYITVYCGDGDDSLSISGNTVNNNIIYGGNGNDNLSSSGENNTLYGGSGNDTITSLYSPCKAIFKNGDGTDYIKFNSNVVLEFEDTNINNLIAFKDGDNLSIGHNIVSGIAQDKVVIEGYYLENYSGNVAILNGDTTINLADAVQYLTEPAAPTVNYTWHKEAVTGNSIIATQESEYSYNWVTDKPLTTGNDTITLYTGTDYEGNAIGASYTTYSGMYDSTTDGGTDTIYGTNLSDNISSSSAIATHVVYGYAGNDTIYGGLGTIYGGIGNDSISGVGTLYGEDGNDYLSVSSGANAYGGAGDDTISSYGKDIHVEGGTDNDTYIMSINTSTSTTSETTIYDEEGTSDKLQISNLKDSLVLYMDIQIDSKGNIVENNSKNLYIASTSRFAQGNGADLTVTDYFVEGHEIENIVTRDGYTLSKANIITLRNNLATWLKINQYTSISDVLQNGTTAQKDAIKSLSSNTWYREEVAGNSIKATQDSYNWVTDKPLTTGNDTITLHTGLDDQSSEIGASYACYSSMYDSITDGGTDIIYGTDLADYISSGTGIATHVVYGYAGNDTIYGGLDTIYGGIGDDSIMSEGTLYGEDGNDYLFVSSSGANAYGGAGDDTICTSSKGIHHIEGGTGNDTYTMSVNTSTSTTAETTIYDEEGTNDELQISNMKDSLVLYMDIKIDSKGNIIENDSKNLYIASTSRFNQGNGANLTVTDYFVEGHEIENIVTKDGYTLSKANIITLRNNLATWLKTNQYTSISDVLQNGTTAQKDAIKSLSSNTWYREEVAGNSINATQESEYSYNWVTDKSLTTGNDTITLYTGTDYEGNAIGASYTCYSSMYDSITDGGTDIIYGTNLSDYISSGTGIATHVVYGYAGNDTIYGGLDTIYGGIGNDSISGAGILYGEEGNDYLSVSSGGSAYGGAGDDTISSYGKDIHVEGGTDNDTYIMSINTSTSTTSETTVYDEEGTNDELQISNMKDSLVLYMDIEIDGNGDIVENNSKNLYITSTSRFGQGNGADLTVTDYFVEGHEIENIVTRDGYYTTSAYLNAIRQDVAGWLQDKGYTSVNDVIETHDETLLSELQAQFNSTYQQAV